MFLCRSHAGCLYADDFLRAGHLEEHLLICSECRDHLKATDEYVAAMRSAAAKIRESGTGE
jgi:predicted anti-sigma-YlaC factor YlaD